MRLSVGLVFAFAFTTGWTCTAAAQPHTPWEPVLDLGGAEIVNSQQLADRGRYPRHAVRQREQGQVVVAFEITAKGRARNCRIVRSSGYRRLDNVPCPIFEGWAKFRPAIGEDGQPVVVTAMASAEFALAGN